MVMEKVALSLFVLSVVAGAVGGQANPRDGDLVVTYGDFSFSQGAALVVRPSTGTWSTLATPSQMLLRGIRMAADNNDLWSGTWNASLPQNDLVVRVTPAGSVLTVARIPGGGTVFGLGLDHDCWVLAGAGAKNDSMWSLSLQNNALSTLFSVPHQRGTSGGEGMFFDMTIDRDAGAPTYVVARWQGSSTMVTPRLEGADRQGIVTTIYRGIGDPLRSIHGVELDPTSGDYLVSVAPPTTHLYLSLLALVSKNGSRVTTLQSGQTGPVSATVKINQDGTAWVAGRPNAVDAVLVYRIDLKKNKIIKSLTIPIPGVWPSGIEVYGSRRLVCSGTGQPGTTVKIALRSHKATDAGKYYAVACSLARRPGVTLSNGETLNLDVTGNLFMISALGGLPAVFQDFQGKTDAFGAANARVNIPGNLPPNLSITVFAAGIIYDAAGVSTVTNTHWFQL